MLRGRLRGSLTKKKLRESWSAYHLYEKPGNPNENSNGTVHPGGKFPEKSNTFRGIAFFPF